MVTWNRFSFVEVVFITGSTVYCEVMVTPSPFPFVGLLVCYILRFLFMTFLVVCFPAGLCYLCLWCLKRRGTDSYEASCSSSDTSSGVSDLSDDEDDPGEFTVSYQRPYGAMPRGQDIKLKAE